MGGADSWFLTCDAPSLKTLLVAVVPLIEDFSTLDLITQRGEVHVYCVRENYLYVRVMGIKYWK